MDLSRRFTTNITKGPYSKVKTWVLLIIAFLLRPLEVVGGSRLLWADNRHHTTGARTILQTPDQSSAGVSLGQELPSGQVKVVNPPGGSYTLATSQQLFKDALTITDPEKRIRLPPNTILQLCEGQTITHGSHVIVDCQDSTFDLRCSEWFHLDSDSRVELFRCHVLWPPKQDFSSLQIGTQLLRVEEDSVLTMQGGSFTIWCEVRHDPPCTCPWCAQAVEYLSCCSLGGMRCLTAGDSMQELLDMPGATALSQLSPGDSVPIAEWSTTFVDPTGTLELRDVTLYCTSKDLVFDTSADTFSEALGRAAVANSANQTIQLTGAQCGLSHNSTRMFELFPPEG